MRNKAVIIGAVAFLAIGGVALAIPAREPLREVAGPPVGDGSPYQSSSLSVKRLTRLLIEEEDYSEHGRFFQNIGVIDYIDIMAIFQVESRFNPEAIKRNDGGKGVHAYGIGQVLSTTAADMGFTNPNDLLALGTGVDATMKYLRWIFDFLRIELGKPPSKNQWIGAYNMGVGNIVKGRSPLIYLAKHKVARAFI